MPTHVALADGCVQAGHVGDLEVRRNRGQRLQREEPLERHAGSAELVSQLLLALVDRLLAALAGEVLADLLPSARTLDELQPVS